MKDNLFEMLLNLFEKSLAQIQKSHGSADKNASEAVNEEELEFLEDTALFVKSAQSTSTRVFTYQEQMKLTKASYQFLMRMKLLGVLDSQLFELILNQLVCSDSRIVTLKETKWTIRNVLAMELNEGQLAFLDLVLYQVEDNPRVQ